MKAGKRLCHRWVKPSDIPSNAELHDEIQRMAWLFEGNSRFNKLKDVRIQAFADDAPAQALQAENHRQHAHCSNIDIRLGAIKNGSQLTVNSLRSWGSVLC